MSDEQARREALLAAALAGALDERQQSEFDLACTTDPSLLADLNELRELTRRLERADLSWEDDELPPGLADRVFGATAVTPSVPASPFPPRQLGRPGRTSRTGRTRPASANRPRRARFALAAAGLVMAGAVGGQAVSGALQAPPGGPPGTLGAEEELTFSTRPAGTTFDAALVAHTWGTETVLELDGLAVGRSFEVVLVGVDGEQYVSGTFLGADRTVTCRMNAAVLRQDVSHLQIRDDDGAVVAVSDVVGL
jgi:hypothetical protein